METRSASTSRRTAWGCAWRWASADCRTRGSGHDLLPRPPPRRGPRLPRRHPHQRRRRQRRHLPQAPRAPAGARPGVRARVGRQPGHHPGGARPHRPRPRQRRRPREPGHRRPPLRGGALRRPPRAGRSPTQHRAALGAVGADGTATFILGGQIAGERPDILLVYPEGNYIRASDERPFLQIGESKYGKFMLELAVKAHVDLRRRPVKIALGSMMSTARANLSVGPPYDLGDLPQRLARARRAAASRPTRPYLAELQERWATAPARGHRRAPPRARGRPLSRADRSSEACAQRPRADSARLFRVEPEAIRASGEARRSASGCGCSASAG